MKPLGPIPAGFVANDGVLAIDGAPVTQWVAVAGGTPLFIYSRAMIAARIAALRAAMPADLAIHYAVKANPFAPLLAAMAAMVDGFDIASTGELAAARAAGMPGAAISFAGPGKRDDDLAAAIAGGVTINLESEAQARRALALAEALGIRPRLAIRINPDFALNGAGLKLGGGPSVFGLDAELVAPLARHLVERGADFRGLHLYVGSQALDTQAIIAAQGAVVALAARLAREAGVPLPTLTLGAGFGIPYVAGQKPVDIAAMGAALRATLAARPPELAGTSLALELGRWLVGEAGVYLARIIERKVSRGRVFHIIDGGLHHLLAASGNFGMAVRRNYPVAIATKFGVAPAEVATIAGCLCTPLDVLADAAHLPCAEEGDIVAVFCAGAYGASASPVAFLSHPPAREMLV